VEKSFPIALESTALDLTVPASSEALSPSIRFLIVDLLRKIKMEKPIFLNKKQREEEALKRLQEKREQEEERRRKEKESHERFITGKALEERKLEEKRKREEDEREKQKRMKEANKESIELEHELQKIREQYLGNTEEKPNKIVKPSEKFTKLFQFDWAAEDDTSRDDYNPLYSKRMKINALFGRGYIAGVDQREQRNKSNFLMTLSEKRMQEHYKAEEEHLSIEERNRREKDRLAALERFQRQQQEQTMQRLDEYEDGKSKHWSEKVLDAMTDRDWRIFREDFDIRIQGGRAQLPMRYWSESSIPKPILQAIEKAGYKEPSPIQRQAIPVGLHRKDLLGIAETGSGKTCAFLVPMLSYLMSLPSHHFDRLADQGPLACVLAPTRELAQQIHEECMKLASYTKFQSICIVGGQSIEEQGLKLIKGVEILIGTPGRIIDCMEHNYLVLNQCAYVVLDEADRMVDMGFDDQVIRILDQMGGLLKSEDENIAEQQLSSNATNSSVQYRVTAMFSATMPSELEIIARRYLRHPVSVRIGDVDTGKNKRIEQRVFFLSEAQKRGKLIEELAKLSRDDKVIIFVNLKKTGDTIAWQLESNQHYKVGILHGGKSQDQREETLEHFRQSKIQILVATDVAGRGLDIPDVSHVINYEMPNKIQAYCHRIGRTGRAGKYGVATTFITDADSEVLYDLRQYLESTDSVIPQALAHHAAAQAPPGTRDDKGKLVGGKKDSVVYAK
jgi:ATP-dependent RNA helicase DDX23/PRP28